ncbi:MAG: DUF2334 domain-containing protein [Candidatus Micrarchaeota archaeon]
MVNYAAIAIHDAAPAHFKNIKRVTDYLHTEGIKDFSYLVVPKYHNRKGQDIRDSGEFTGWLKKQKKELVLHGLYHKSGFGRFFENEFEFLNYDKAHKKFEEGEDIFKQAFSRKPEGFIPPMWLISKKAVKAAEDFGFKYTTSERYFHNFESGRKFNTAVMPHKNVFLISSSLNALLKMEEKKPVQIAIHPNDGLLKIKFVRFIMAMMEKRGYKFVDYKTFVKKT